MKIKHLPYWTLSLLSFLFLNTVLPSHGYSVKNVSQLENYDRQETNLSDLLNLPVNLNNYLSQTSQKVEDLNKLAREYQGKGEYQQAIEVYQQLLNLARQNNDRFQEGSASGNLGNNHRLLGNYNRALTYYGQSLPIWQELNNQQAVANVYRGMGNVNLNLGNYDRALELHQQSLTITTKINDKLGQAESYLSIGAVYSHQKKERQALQNYQKSLELAKELDNLNLQGLLLNNIGTIEHNKQNYAKAIEYYQPALDIAKQTNNLRLQAATLKGIGFAYVRIQKYQEGIRYQEEGREIADSIGDKNLEAFILQNLGWSYWESGDFVKAESNLNRSIAIGETLYDNLPDLDRVSLFDTQVRRYDLLQKILIDQNKVEEALVIAESGRAKAFVALIARQLSAKKQAQLEVDVRPPNLAEIKQIARQQNSTIVEYYLIDDKYFISQGKQRGEYHQLYIWVVNPQGKIDFRKVQLSNQDRQLIQKSGEWAKNWQRKNIENDWFRRNNIDNTRGVQITSIQLQDLIETITETKNNLRKNFSESHQQMYRLLIEPISDLLPESENETVVFIPQGELFQVSFAALQDSQGKYLIEKHTVVTAPAIQVFSLMQKYRQNESNRALVVGNPTMPQNISLPNNSNRKISLIPLPGAEEEAREIAQIINSKAMIGDSATETTVKRQISDAQIVHFATHGLLEDFDRSGIPGAIALAPSSQDDGLLTASEILDLNLNARLVVISACDTGRGYLTGDGVIGLSRSMIAAGASNVIISLWEVNDQSTKELMTEFYRQRQKDVPYPRALRQAILKTMETPEYLHPTYWSAFTLMGGM